jgi:hypothetical protein
MPGMSHFVLKDAIIPDRRPARHAVIFAALVGLGLALGACSKCNVPTWQPNRPGPLSCHDGPAPQ